MKLNTNTQKQFLSGLVGLALGGAAIVAWADPISYVVNTYDTSASIAGDWNWWGMCTPAWDRNQDAYGSPSSGSLYLAAQYGSSLVPSDNQQQICVAEDFAHTSAWNNSALIDGTLYTNLQFYIKWNNNPSNTMSLAFFNSDGGGLEVYLTDSGWGNHSLGSLPIPSLAANGWVVMNYPYNPSSLSGISSLAAVSFHKYNTTAATNLSYAFWIDNVQFQGNSTPAVTNTPVSITVDAQLNRHPISPLIYGVCGASSSQLADGNFTMNRLGGNEETTYNWQANAHGKGADWYFESYPDSSSTPFASADSFVTGSKNGGAQPMITVSMIGWMPKLGSGRSILWSYSVNKYGPQTSTDPYRSDAGNGISSTNNNSPITWNNPNDANFPTNSAFEQAYVQHFISSYGASTNGGVGYYLMDNEETIWHSTHQDIHPVGATMDEIRTNFFTYAGMVKALDPNALVCGPEEWGWGGYFYSGYDQQWSGAHQDWNPAHYPDRGTNGGWDYCPWLLNQIHQHDTSTGQRLLDYFTLHCYPQSGEALSDDVSTTMQLLRNRSTRQLWDTNYLDPSWINSIVMLIPRMKNWVATYYPGTKIGITEYNWGGEGNINGATAQADILGIFGREGLDLATRWTAVATSDPVHRAMKMYRNYDGNKSTFGDTSVSATGPNPDNVSTFAAVRSSDGALTLMVINKQLTASATATISLANFQSTGTSQVWQLTSANTITRLSDIAFSGTTFTSAVPAQSITLFVLPAAVVAGPASNPSPSNGAANVATNASLSWTAGANATSHEVFFGTSSNAVANATTASPEFKGSVGTANYSPGPLALNTAYYWRVDEIAGAYATTGAVWTFTTPLLAGVASNPNPGNGATGVAVNPNLGWTAGANATSHQVYFGASSNAVANATTGSAEFKGNLSINSYAPGTLASSGRFYWRVDEMAGTSATTGPVWTFATVVNPSATFPLTGALGSGNSFAVTFPSLIGQTYRVERTDSLTPTDWQTVSNNVPGTGNPIVVPDNGVSVQRQRFYRALVLPP